jgi:6-phosphogluconolactonase
VGEGSSIGPRKEGAVTSFAIQPSGRLEQINQQPSGGGGPCHLAVDAKGTEALVANYGSGSIAAILLDEDGKLGEAKTVLQHKGSSVDKRRQAGPHAHQIITDPSGKFAVVCDLGLDQVLVYRMAGTAILEPNDPPYGSVKPGAGPRHLDFHPNGRWVYVINEMGSSVTAFHYDAQRGALKEFQTVSTLPPSFQGNSSCAEIEVHPSGKFLYGSNRGHDSVAVFSISDTGELSAVEHEPCGGKTPRFIGIDPSGKWLLSANQDSDNVKVFRIDSATGALSPSESTIDVGKPVCLVFHKR